MLPRLALVDIPRSQKTSPIAKIDLFRRKNTKFEGEAWCNSTSCVIYRRTKIRVFDVQLFSSSVARTSKCYIKTLRLKNNYSLLFCSQRREWRVHFPLTWLRKDSIVNRSQFQRYKRAQDFWCKLSTVLYSINSCMWSPLLVEAGPVHKYFQWKLFKHQWTFSRNQCQGRTLEYCLWKLHLAHLP